MVAANRIAATTIQVTAQPGSPPGVGGSSDLYVTALAKGPERYVFLYDDDVESREEILRVFGRYAANPELSFTWTDAALLSHKLREEARQLPIASTRRITDAD